jgi:hypothetical protein
MGSGVAGRRAGDDDEPMRLITAALVVALAACSDDEPPAPSPIATPVAETEPAVVARAAEPAAASAGAAIPEAAIHTLLDAWLAAQNTGDFGAYAELYAARFQGVKRSGDRARSFDRAGWLADRRKMFAKPMEVELSAVALQSTEASAVASFEQRWSSSSYRDVGPKRLVVVREGDALRIAREEMIASEVTGRGGPAALPLGRFFFVLPGDAGVVLHTEAEDAWSKGTAELVSRDEVVTAAKEVAPAAIPPALAALSGADIRLYDARGERCAAKLGALRVLRRVTPHFGTVQAWAGEGGRAEATDAAIAEDAWALGRGGLLTAKLEGGAECEGALFAELASAPPLTPYPLKPAEGADIAALLNTAHGTAAYTEVQRELGQPTPFEMAEGGAMTLLTGESGGRRIGAVELLRVASCAELNAHLFMPMDFVEGRWKPRGEAVFHTTPLAAFDLDADGTVEYLGLELSGSLVLLRAAGPGGYQVAETAPVTYLDCPC